MKRLDMTDICVVYAGNDWRHALPPCSREMMIHLERNEKLVSWLQPVNGTVHDQLPAIRVNNQFYSISLRMMKAIWRHVRLRKGFDNVERAPYGGLKLKIPMTLLAEKLRTQSRFNVMRMSTPHATPTAVKERKVSQSASCKIDSVIRQLFLPMLSMPTPERTSFMAEDAEDQLLRQVAQEKPGILATETDFVEFMVILYRKFQRESIGSYSIRFGINGRKQSAEAAEATTEIATKVCDTECEHFYDSFDSNRNDAIDYQEVTAFTARSDIISEVPSSSEPSLITDSTSKMTSKGIKSKTRVDSAIKSKLRAGQRTRRRSQPKLDDDR